MSLLPTDYQRPSLLEKVIRQMRTAFEDGVVGVLLILTYIFETWYSVIVALVHHIKEIRKL